MNNSSIKEIDGFPGYFISDEGRLFSTMRGEFKERSKPLTRQGYERVMLYKNKNPIAKRVHRLVAKAFIPNPENKPCVNHKDGNKQNNNISNLEWATYSENSIHSFENELQVPLKGSDVYNSKLTESDVRQIRRLYKREDVSQHYLADRFSVSRWAIRKVINKENWAHI